MDSKVLESRFRGTTSIQSDRPITNRLLLKSLVSDKHSKRHYRIVRSRAISRTCLEVLLKCIRQWFTMPQESLFPSMRLLSQANAHHSPSKNLALQIQSRQAQSMDDAKLRNKMNFYYCRERVVVGDLCLKSQRKVRFARASVASRRLMRRQKEPNLVLETTKSQRCAYLTLTSRLSSARSALEADLRSFQSLKRALIIQLQQ